MVQMRAVDSLLKHGEVAQPQFVKVDVEGAELLALDGMRETLKRTRAVFVECHYALDVDLGLGDPLELVTAKLDALGAVEIVPTNSDHVLAYFDPDA